MSKKFFDIDIDFPTDFNPLGIFKDVVLASMVHNKQLVKHPSGAYLQTIPVDKQTGLSAIPYKEAEQLGYIKIDFLHLSLLDVFKSKKEIRALMKKDPDWSILSDEKVIEQLFQLHNHVDVVKNIKPTSVEELSDCVALIRPAKRYLIDIYLGNKEIARKYLYKKGDDNQYYFKKSHAVAYAMTIVLQMHLIKSGIV